MITQKKVYNTLIKYLENSQAMNITMVIFGIRSAYWYDGWDLNTLKMKKLLKYLDTFKKKRLLYKWGEGGKEGEREGPLIYNTKIINKNLIHKIENIDIDELYHTPDFGTILGYECPLDIFKIDRKERVVIDYDLNIEKKRKKGRVEISSTQLYGFYCYKKKINVQKIYNKLVEMDKFVKKINLNFSVKLEIEM